MALVSSSDLSHSIVKETTFGTTPTTGATRYELPAAADQEPLTASASVIASNTKRPMRSSNGSRRGMEMVEGSVGTRFVKAAFMDLLLENALCNSFATNVLKAGETDSSFSLITKFASDMYKINAGCAVTGFTISAKGNEEVGISFDIMGSKQTRSAVDNALTVTNATGLTEFIGSEVNTITVAGETLQIAELSFSTKLDKTRRPVLGSNNSLAYGVNGVRETILTVKAYRESFAVDTAITGLAQACSFRIGGTGTGYSFEMPAAYGDIPKDTLSDGSAFVEINFSAGYDATAGTSLVVTKL